MINFPKRTKKTPKAMRFTGFEIECITEKPWNDRENYDRYYSNYDANVLGGAKKFVLNIHDDGSVEGDGFPAEVVTQPLLENRKSAIKSLCDSVKKRGGYVNRSCGGHIHVDAKDLKSLLRDEENMVIAVKFLTLCEPALYAVTGKGRIGNSFCNPLGMELRSEYDYDTNKEEDFWDDGDLKGDRYHSINFCALEDHGTLEFRLFAGTLEHEKWIARAAFAEAIVNKLKKVIENPKLLKKFHRKSHLSGLDLDKVIDISYNKRKLYKDLITNNGADIVECVGKMVGLHKNYRKVLVEQHNSIWSKYAKNKKNSEESLG